MTTLYFAGLVGMLSDLPATFFRMLSPVFKYLWTPLAFMIVALFGGACFFIAIGGPISFNLHWKGLPRARLTLSSAILAVLYITGSPLHFRRQQWLWLDSYMCGQLMSVGYAMPGTKWSSWLAFGMLVLAWAVHPSSAGWVVIDYVWAVYMALLAIAPWVLNIPPAGIDATQ